MKINFSVLLIIIILILSSLGLGRDIKKDFHESFEVKSGDMLYLYHGDGDVTISSWDKHIIEIEVYFSANIFGLAKDEYDFDIQFKQNGNKIEVTEKLKRNHRFGIRGITINRYEYLIKLPKYLLLNLDGDDGNVEIKDMAASIDCHLSDGDLQISHVSADQIKLSLEDGSLKMDDIAADLNISMDDGDVTIADYTGKDCSIDLKDGRLELNRVSSNFDIHCDDGDIELHHIRTNLLKITANDGDVYIDLIQSENPDIAVKVDDAKVVIDFHKEISAKIEIETDDGSIDTRISDAEYEKKKRNYYNAEINGGKGKVHIETNDGNIILRKSS
ncbi:MAG: DUF4097 family beta strand repeat protein [Calditrichaceae bacterium]|nr:DUF4097 family beta strand repeat protein [Calditrichaceae bacterium]